MPCFHPLSAFRCTNDVHSKFEIIFCELKSRRYAIAHPLTLPCGRCVGCRLERSRQWAIRCVHEASLHENNCFLTLTYSEDKVPSDGSLNVRHWQLFMKRFKSWVRRNCGKEAAKRIRFFHAGEYGDKLGRPHYHACIFGYDFSDKYLWQVRRGVPLYRSPSLESLWTFGHSSIGTVTFESAAYVARYCMKKIVGRDAEDHYRRFYPDTGEEYFLQPEYTTQSNGIGRGWFEKYKSDVFPDDFILINGCKVRPPRYYQGLYELCDSDGMAAVKERREYRVWLQHKKALFTGLDNFTPARLNDREQIVLARTSRLLRSLTD